MWFILKKHQTPFDTIIDAHRENDILFIQNPHQLSLGCNASLFKQNRFNSGRMAKRFVHAAFIIKKTLTF